MRVKVMEGNCKKHHTQSKVSKCLIIIYLLLNSIKLSSQTIDEVFNAALSDFSTLMEYFIQQPTNAEQNKIILNKLIELQDLINKVHVTREERYKLNSLNADINVVKDFMSPVSGGINIDLKKNHFTRLQNIFGQLFTQVMINVNCPKEEVEFVEVNLGKLKICYFHNISRKAASGIRIKYYGSSGNSQISGEYGAFFNEYTPVLNNVGNQYVRINSASIIDRF